MLNQAYIPPAFLNSPSWKYRPVKNRWKPGLPMMEPVTWRGQTGVKVLVDHAFAPQNWFGVFAVVLRTNVDPPVIFWFVFDHSTRNGQIQLQ